MAIVKSEVVLLYTLYIVGNHQNLNLRETKKGVGKEHRQSVPNVEITLLKIDTYDNAFRRAKAAIQKLPSHSHHCTAYAHTAL